MSLEKDKKKNKKDRRHWRMIGLGLLILGMGTGALSITARMGGVWWGRQIQQEQRETVQETKKIVEELGRLTGELTVQRETIQARYGRLTQEQRARMPEILDELAEQAYLLEEEYLRYRTDFSVQLYPFRDQRVDRMIGKLWPVLVPIDQLIRTGELVVVEGGGKEELARMEEKTQKIEEQLAAARARINELGW